jgi:hypothetical protein
VYGQNVQRSNPYNHAEDLARNPSAGNLPESKSYANPTSIHAKLLLLMLLVILILRSESWR